MNCDIKIDHVEYLQSNQFTIVNDPSEYRKADRYIKIEDPGDIMRELFPYSRRHDPYRKQILFIRPKKIKKFYYLVYQLRYERQEFSIIGAESFIVNEEVYQYIKYMML